MRALLPALALLEFDSIALGIAAGDAMVKRAPVKTIFAGTVHPGRYLVLVAGDVASVEESLDAGLSTSSPRDQIYLPGMHPELARLLSGGRNDRIGEALGVVETRSVASILGVADRGLKGADVRLHELRLADGLGGKAFCTFTGLLSDVEAAVELGVEGLENPESLVGRVVIPQIHEDMLINLGRGLDFSSRLGGSGG